MYILNARLQVRNFTPSLSSQLLHLQLWVGSMVSPAHSFFICFCVLIPCWLWILFQTMQYLLSVYFLSEVTGSVTISTFFQFQLFDLLYVQSLLRVKCDTSFHSDLYPNMYFNYFLLQTGCQLFWVTRNLLIHGLMVLRLPILISYLNHMKGLIWYVILELLEEETEFTISWMLNPLITRYGTR